ncbi:coiled-coil domain-containing protein 177-like isoform X2 [Gigantopelta aegis]|nr:coiled-coil domain-containing protein 177-like isoform X2 [Gigantopelta aegis]
MVKDTGGSVSLTHTPLKLDLYNFEEPQYEGSKFVLTSPRSLEACSRLGIKPVDLLYKPLAEFQEELLPQDVPLRTIYNIYDEQEQTRLRNLQLCREERNNLIDKELSKQHGHSNKPSVVISKVLLDNEMDQGSMQRRRTAWSTSVGHQRLTNDEINQRAKELHEESLKLKRELLSRKEERLTKGAGKKTSKDFSGAGRSCPIAFRSPTSAPSMKVRATGHEQRRPVSSQTRMFQRPSKEDKRSVSSQSRISVASRQEQKGPVKSRTRTLLTSNGEQKNPLSSRTRTLLTDEEQKRPCSSRTRTLVMLSDEDQKRPISSKTRTVLVSRPGSAPVIMGSKSVTVKTNMSIPSRDMKIIQLMKDRRLEEIVSKRISRNAHLAWDEERRKEQVLKDQSEMRRRQLLAEENRNWNRAKQNSDLEKRQEEEALMELKAQAIKNKTDKWETSFSKQLMVKENKLADKIEMENLRKCIQERNLQGVEKDEQEMNTRVYEKILQDLKTAALKKEVRLQIESMKKQRANKQERESFERRKKYYEQLMRKEEDMLRTSVDSKHNKAASKFERILNSKLNSLSLMHQQREKRLQKARLAQKRMDDQMAAWREGLLEQRRKAEEHAVETVVRTNEMKAERAHRERVERQKEHKANIKKVQQELMLWHKNLEKSVNAKLKKADLMQEEKNIAAMQTRAIAQESQRLRDEVRNRYNTDTFDKKALQADCYAKMGGGIYSSTKNLSSIKLAE